MTEINTTNRGRTVNLAVGDRVTCILCLRKSSLLSAHLVIAG